MKYTYELDKVISIIPARSGSKGIIDKNISDIKGFPLIAYSIVVANLIKEISRVIVSTDSMKYAEIAKIYGAEVPFLRPSEISGSNSKDIEYLQYTLDGLFKEEGAIPEFVVLLRPTTPIRDVNIVEKAIEMLKENKNATAVVSIHPIEECPYKWMTISKQGYLESPFSELLPDDVNLPRQSFRKVYEPDGYVDVLRSKEIMENGVAYGTSAIPLEIDENIIDIDTYEDLDLIKKSNITNNILYKYLSKIKL